MSIQVIKVSKISINNSYGSGDPHFDFSATINGKRLLKEQIPVGSLVQGKCFDGTEIVLLATKFVDESTKNDPTKALWRGKAINMPLPLATYFQTNRTVEANEKQAKSAYTDVKGKGYVSTPEKPEVVTVGDGIPVETVSVSEMF